LKQMREQLSTSLGIEPGFLLNNALINSIAWQKPSDSSQLLNIENIRRWQVENIGDDIFAAC
jgi:ribonuclease D